MTPFDLSVTDALLSTTRAVRKRLDLERPVPLEIVQDCLELAMQAPTGSNRQGWSWIVVTDADRRRALAELYRKNAGHRMETAYQEALAAGASEDARVFDSARYLAERLQDVPVHVIPCIHIGDPSANLPRDAWARLMGSIFPAVWSFQLALRARGLGSVLTTLHLRCEAEAAELLEIPEDVMQVALLPVAYTLGTDFKPGRRRPLDETVHWEKW